MTDHWAFVAAVVDSIAWPLVALITLLTLRKPAARLLSLIRELQYKDVAVRFQRDAERARQDAPLTEREDAAGGSLSADMDPRSAVLDAWLHIEKTAVEKYKELERPSGQDTIDSGNAVAYFEFTRALTPTTRRVLTDLRSLRNQAVHSSGDRITRDAAEAYIEAATSIRKQIDAMSSLPAIRLSYLTSLILEYNSLIDTGKYDDITLSEVHRHIEAGTVLKFIEERAGEDADLSLHRSSGPFDQPLENYYARYMRAIYEAQAGNEGRKWGVENRGLCLLVAWTNEIIQQGGGWYPTDEFVGPDD